MNGKETAERAKRTLPEEQWRELVKAMREITHDRMSMDDLPVVALAWQRIEKALEQLAPVLDERGVDDWQVQLQRDWMSKRKRASVDEPDVG
jgi:uncharacterized protein with HEPN domain